MVRLSFLDIPGARAVNRGDYFPAIHTTVIMGG